jgi:hypothetical protein
MKFIEIGIMNKIFVILLTTCFSFTQENTNFNLSVFSIQKNILRLSQKSYGLKFIDFSYKSLNINLFNGFIKGENPFQPLNDGFNGPEIETNEYKNVVGFGKFFGIGYTSYYKNYFRYSLMVYPVYIFGGVYINEERTEFIEFGDNITLTIDKTYHYSNYLSFYISLDYNIWLKSGKSEVRGSINDLINQRDEFLKNGFVIVCGINIIDFNF